MRPRLRTVLTIRGVKALAILAVSITASGCYSCSLNGGWEGQLNPFCVEKGSLVGQVALPDSAASESKTPAG